MFKKIKNNFFTGLVVTLPAVLTIVIFGFFIRQINEKILNPILKLFGIDFSSLFWINIAKGTAFVSVIIITILIGMATRFILLRKLFGFGEDLVAKVPMLGKIYLTIKEISRASLGEGKLFFKRVVLFEYPRSGLYSLGFVTMDGCYEEFKKKTKVDSVHVFLPTSPNPTTGFFLIIPKKEVIPLEMSVTDAFKLIVSGGAFPPALQSPYPAVTVNTAKNNRRN
ncbi:MAG: DUF502 domain-containing protein [Candidatus Omnitrophota bacterium]